jgi:arsenite/tail-anchored protein-transporting ATPase
VRTLLFTGPGGAGTTTIAAAAAVRAAASGARTLLLTMQEPRLAGLADVPGLEVRTVDPQRALETLWRDRAEDVGSLLPQLDVPPASSVVPLPGAGDLALFAELGRADADVVVVDAGPLERVTALLGLPGTLRWWLEQVLPPRLRALGAVRTAALRAGAVRRGPVDAALAAVPVVEGLLDRVTLTDPGRTSVALVATAAPDAAAALRRAVTTLGLYGQRPTAVLVRLLPAGEGEWWTRRAAEQDAVLPLLAELAEVVRLPELPSAPVDVAGLAELVARLDATAVDPAALDPTAAHEPPAPATERLDGGWRLVLPLPFAESGRVELTRWADDLVVTASGVRRSLRLDALLRRCQVTGGRLLDPGTPDARLEVTFVADPGQWPADLLAAEGGGA